MSTFTWPGSSGGSGSNASVGTNGVTAPTSSTEVGGINPGGNLQPLQTDVSSNLLVNVSTSALPTGAATAANQASQITQETSTATSAAAINTKTPSLGQTTMSGSVPVTLANDQTPLPDIARTDSTLANGTYTWNVSGYNTLTIQQTGSFTTGTFTFAASNDGTNFQALYGYNITSRATTNQIVNASFFMDFNVGGFSTVRMVVTSFTGGPANAVSRISSGLNALTVLSGNASAFLSTSNIKDSNGNNILQGQQTSASSLGVVLASDQSSISTTDASLDTYVTGFAPATAVINTNILLTVAATTATDLQGFRSIAFQVNTGASTTAVAVNFEGSNDNVNFVAVAMYDKTTPTAAPVTTFTTAASTQRYFEGPTEFRYFRARLNAAIVAGTIQAFTILRKTSYQMTNNSLAAGTQVIGSLAANQSSNVAQINAVTPLMGTGVTGTGSLRVTSSTSTTATLSNVAGSATTVTVLASNANRRAATFFNESTAVLYLKFGATASLTSYTVQIPANGYYEMPVPSVYTGICDGLWAAANGNVRVTEIT